MAARVANTAGFQGVLWGRRCFGLLSALVVVSVECWEKRHLSGTACREWSPFVAQVSELLTAGVAVQVPSKAEFCLCNHTALVLSLLCRFLGGDTGHSTSLSLGSPHPSVSAFLPSSTGHVPLCPGTNSVSPLDCVLLIHLGTPDWHTYVPQDMSSVNSDCLLKTFCEREVREIRPRILL